MEINFVQNRRSSRPALQDSRWARQNVTARNAQSQRTVLIKERSFLGGIPQSGMTKHSRF